VLTEPEKLDNETYILFYSLRDVEKKQYVETREVKLKCKKLNDLQEKALELFGSLADDIEATVSDFVILKHVPHQFNWQILDPNEIIIEKQGGGKGKNRKKK